MSWAGSRRLVILLIAGAFVAALIAIIVIASVHKTPTCTDHIQDQGETGIDCGGPCPYLCTDQESAPIALFARTVPNGAGRTDVIAVIENKNSTAAARGVPYTISILDAKGSLVRTIHGAIDLPPNTTEPVFVPGVGNTAASAFLTFDDTNAIRWFTFAGTRTVPVASNVVLSGTAGAPVITGTLTNRSATPLANVRAIVLVHDADGNVIAASQTVVPTVPAEGQAQALFTWSGAFSGTPVAIEVDPVIPLGL